MVCPVLPTVAPALVGTEHFPQRIVRSGRRWSLAVCAHNERLDQNWIAGPAQDGVPLSGPIHIQYIHPGLFAARVPDEFRFADVPVTVKSI